MSSFWFRLGTKDNGGLTLYPRELPLVPTGLRKSTISKGFVPPVFVQKGENSNIYKAEKWAQAVATELPAIHQPGQKKVPKKKEIALRGSKSTGDALLAQEMSSFRFRSGGKDNGRLILYPWELPLSLNSLRENCCGQKGENSNIDKAEEWVSATPKQLPQICWPCINLVRKRYQKKEIALRGSKSTGDALLEQKMSGFLFRFGAKDNGGLTLDPWELPLSLVGSHWSANCSSQKGENSNSDKAEKLAQATATELPAMHQPSQKKAHTKKKKKKKKKKEIGLRGHKSTGDALLAQEMSGFWFCFGAKDNGRLTLDRRKLPLSLVSSYGSA
ncbi:hypothetical protein CDAR_529471 [Caerostris darwini]|uniref:Uncharacterized protein n=1 Tax=Caerostris darwini TaxID=1538125 RepID=A0AAV4SEN4_9ARAC|nr:hypothetical protein CDAR_529471 [Caerostris darwini]